MTWYREIVVFLLTASTAAQSKGSIAYWLDARSGVVRDTLYLEGGLMTNWIDVDYGLYSSTGHGLSQFNFSTSFNQSTNFTDLLKPENVISDPLQHPHVNGFLFADDDEWYSFGGQAYPIANNQTVNPLVIRDGIYKPNAAAVDAPIGISSTFSPQGNRTNLYITNGGGVSVPSESLGFYFSGLRSNASSDMSFTPQSASDTPFELVKTMLKVDTHSYAQSDWAEIPLPDNVTPRAEAMLAWVPVGTRGAIFVIGGVTFPADLYQNKNCNVTNPNKAAANSQAPSFMTNISIYDIATGRWYNQATSGAPPARLAHACAVVASSPDNSTHNIHLYGGYDGVSSTATNDDVWVLSVPSFTWVKVATGTTSHARYGHVCAKPYPDQMMIFGGVTKCREPLVNSTFADVFNLNSLTWTGSYDPLKWSEYVVPTAISDAIKATPTAAMVSGLASLFQTKYTKGLSKWYPYTPVASSATPAPSSTRPNWLIPLIAAIAVVIIIAIIATIWYCRHRGRKNVQLSTNAKSRNRITSWLRGQPYPAKSLRSDDEMTQVDNAYGIHETLGDTHYKPGTRARAAELTNESVFNTPELGSTLDLPPGSASSYGRRNIELSPTSVHYELPAEPITIARRPVGKPRLLSSASGSNSGVLVPTGSVTSPTSGPATSSALSKVQSIESGISAPIEGLALSSKDPTMANIDKIGTISEAAVSPEQTPLASPSTQAVSPPATSTTSPLVSPPRSPPMTPPMQSTSFRPLHMRNASSLSSDLPDLNSPGPKSVSPREEYRRSMVIATLPEISKGSGKVEPRIDGE